MQTNENSESVGDTPLVGLPGDVESLKRSAEDSLEHSASAHKVRKLNDGTEESVVEETLQLPRTDGTLDTLVESPISPAGPLGALENDINSQDSHNPDYSNVGDVNSASSDNVHAIDVQSEASSGSQQEKGAVESQPGNSPGTHTDISPVMSYRGPPEDALNFRREGPASSIRSGDLASDISVPLDTPGPTPPPPSQITPSWVPEEIFDPSVYDRTESSATDSSDESDATAVMREELKDPALRHTYQNLPYLRFAELVPVKHSGDSGLAQSGIELPGLYAMKNWEELFPAKLIILDRIKAALTFSANAVYFNPSRANPNFVAVKPIGDNRYIVNHANQRSCLIAVTTGCSLSCDLVQGKTKQSRGGTSMLLTKSIEIVPHTLEYERLVAFFGRAFDFESIRAACYSGHVLTFSTRTEANEQPISESTSKFRAYLATNLASRSDDKRPTTRNEVSAFIKTSLGASEQVPIYDARNRDFRLHRDAARIPYLPLYKDGHEDLPSGACVSVGYTVGVFKDKRDKTQELLTLNVRWVIVWAIPKLHHVIAE